MNGANSVGKAVGDPDRPILAHLVSRLGGLVFVCVCLLLVPVPSHSQAVIVDQSGSVTVQTENTASTVDRRYAQVTPTDVPLSKVRLNAKTRMDLLRYLQAEQGFAMRPFPRGHRGMTLHANGKLDKAGNDYIDLVSRDGISANPGDRVVITDVKIEDSKMVFQLNGGPDLKHRFLRHIELGTGPVMAPVVNDPGQQPTGARLTLEFKHYVPEMTGKQVEALLAPLISFGVKTPVQAFTDTLPAPLRDAILSHQVLVGMSTDMVLFAKGHPRDKIREMDGQMPFEEWIYGKPPQTVEFVRINGNRVIRVEIAEIGKPPQVFTQDVVDPMMQTRVEPGSAAAPHTHTVQMGDVIRNPDTQAPAPPPSLRKPGEELPPLNRRETDMKPVHFPAQAPDDHPVAHQNSPPDAAQPQPAPADTQQH
ncbi:MAG TPA: hypothetical protein VFI20_12135 [Terracidiphilus sp.]|nr:hypothetical protein [Terracidiphilus sp.]